MMEWAIVCALAAGFIVSVIMYGLGYKQGKGDKKSEKQDIPNRRDGSRWCPIYGNYIAGELDKNRIIDDQRFVIDFDSLSDLEGILIASDGENIFWRVSLDTPSNTYNITENYHLLESYTPLGREFLLRPTGADVSMDGVRLARVTAIIRLGD